MVLRKNRPYRYAVYNGTYLQRLFNTLEEAQSYARKCQRLGQTWALTPHFTVRHRGETVFDATEDPDPIFHVYRDGDVLEATFYDLSHACEYARARVRMVALYPFPGDMDAHFTFTVRQQGETVFTTDEDPAPTTGQKTC